MTQWNTVNFTRNFYALARFVHDSESAIHEEIARNKEASRATNHIRQAVDFKVQSAIGFEPTEHSDSPPCIPTTPTTKPKPCIDFGFEPTEGCE